MPNNRGEVVEYPTVKERNHLVGLRLFRSRPAVPDGDRFLLVAYFASASGLFRPVPAQAISRGILDACGRFTRRVAAQLRMACRRYSAITSRWIFGPVGCI